MAYKLNYRIVGKREMTVNAPGHPAINMDIYDVEWLHEDGLPRDTVDIPVDLKSTDLVITALLDRCTASGYITDEKRALIVDEYNNLIQRLPGRESVGVITTPVNGSARKFIKDQVSVKEGVPLSIVMQALEEKRPALAKSLNVEL